MSAGHCGSELAAILRHMTYVCLISSRLNLFLNSLSAPFLSAGGTVPGYNAVSTTHSRGLPVNVHTGEKRPLLWSNSVWGVQFMRGTDCSLILVGWAHFPTSGPHSSRDIMEEQVHQVGFYREKFSGREQEIDFFIFGGVVLEWTEEDPVVKNDEWVTMA